MERSLYRPENEHDACGIGFVAHIHGNRSHDIVERGLQILINLTHRGAESADNKTGDGAGILTQIPHDLYTGEGIPLPSPSLYGTGLIFLPRDGQEAEACKEIMNDVIRQEGLELISWRKVPVNNADLGDIALSSEPRIEQVFIRGNYEEDELERKLYLTRKQTENRVRASEMKEKEVFYVNSLSARTIIYKGLFTPDQLGSYYPDLRHPSYRSAIALVHSRFSTNTFPSWDLAQPFRYIAHNGEINTIRGNRLWMHAREALMKSQLFRDDLPKLFPVIEPGKSDSASLDNALEFLVQTGRSIPHSLSMLIPESWNDKNPIPKSLKAFYEYHSTFMEPWDGPAAILFSDGRYVGGTLDRNGLRPSRYLITRDDLIIMGSETGVQQFAAGEIREKGRLKPGKLLLVDTKLGIIIPNDEVKSELARRHPYTNWLQENRLEMEQIEVKERKPSTLGRELPVYLKSFGYSKEDIEVLIKPMAEQGKEPINSMGNDAPMAVFSDKPQRLFSYFRQLFAQVTNPPIDPIREGLVMALTNYIGSLQKNILEESPEHCHLIKFKSPIITNTDLGKIKDLRHQMFTHEILEMVYPVNSGGKGLRKALKALCDKAEKAVDNHTNFLILTDRDISGNKAPIPVLLAVSAVHHHLIRVKKRMQVGLIVETGEAREVTHFAQLLAYGASIINPYVAFAVLDDLVKKEEIRMPYDEARKNYIKAIDKGILKIMSKMGISTLRSYFGAQIFEAVGLSEEMINEYFCGTPSQIGGIGIDELAREIMKNHRDTFFPDNNLSLLPHKGIYSYRWEGETHAWNPESIALLQWSVRTGSYERFKAFTRTADNYTNRPVFIRGMLKIRKGRAIPPEEVESEEAIMKRFVTGAMSYGSISREAHEALAIAMNRIGGRSNTGEGGEDPDRFVVRDPQQNRRSAIKQVASGRFGVTTDYLINADEIQIKIAQGAKPGEGGQLPGYKVNKIIARVRHSVPGITLISPPPHHDIYSIEDLAQLIYDLKCANPPVPEGHPEWGPPQEGAKVSVKLVAEVGVGTIAAGVAKGNADEVLISGHDGGTGASPLSSIQHAGAPWELGLAETQQTLMLNGLRDRILVQVDGQLKTGRDVVVAALLGAERFGFGTAALVALGCVLMRKCHHGTCPVGIATQDPELRKRFAGKPEHLQRFMLFVAEEVRRIMAQLGFRRFDEMVGRSDRLSTRKAIDHWKARGLDFSAILAPAASADPDVPRRCTRPQTNTLADHLDWTILKKVQPALQEKRRTRLEMPIRNVHRTVGTILSNRILKLHGPKGLPDGTLELTFHGSAGQSFGAFLAPGVTLRLIGDANDYLGKGLSGGRIVVITPPGSPFVPHENIIAGNTLLYGATAGEAYINGLAGERFAVRNSGAVAVVEGVGDHGCEYMTGGTVVVLGVTGRNFAAGMSGGVAYVLDEHQLFDVLCNLDMVDLESVYQEEDQRLLYELIQRHRQWTNSRRAEEILRHWREMVGRFVKVMPIDYRKSLQRLREREQRQTEFTPATEEVFNG